MDHDAEDMVAVDWRSTQRVSLKRIAQSQRLLLRVFAAYAMSYGFLALSAWLRIYSLLAHWHVGRALAWFELVSFVILTFGVVLLSARLMFATGRNPIIAVFLSALMIVPLLNFLLILSTNRKATSLLTMHGLQVGLLGVDIGVLRELVCGACRRCGYDLRGLTALICPECGEKIAI